MQNQTEDEVAGIDRQLVSRLVDAYGLDPVLAERVVEETFLAYGDTVEEWVRSRHMAFQRRTTLLTANSPAYIRIKLVSPPSHPDCATIFILCCLNKTK